MRFKHLKNQAGQAVLLVLLSLSVVLIVVMYILSRSITDISLTSKEEDSMRAFSAAEAGIERALITGLASSNSDFSGGAFSASVSSFGNASTVIYPISLKSGEIATFWLSRPTESSYTGSQMKICWGDENTIDTPKLELSVYYLAGLNYQVARKFIDPIVGNCTINDQHFRYENLTQFNPSDLNIPNYSTAGVLKFATAKILYNTTTAHKVGIDVTGYGSLPSQGKIITSDGSFAGANRSVEVYQLHPVAPPIFTNAIYSASGIIKGI